MLATNDMHSWVMGVRWMGEGAGVHLPPRGDGDVLPSPLSAGSRVARAERRQLGLRMLKDFAKELPEDQDIVLEDIPGLSASVDSVPDQFALVEAEVRQQLVGSTPAVVDAIECLSLTSLRPVLCLACRRRACWIWRSISSRA